jgi:hypothetical protein
VFAAVCQLPLFLVFDDERRRPTCELIGRSYVVSDKTDQIVESRLHLVKMRMLASTHPLVFGA